METTKTGQIVCADCHSLTIRFEDSFDVAQYLEDNDCKGVSLRFLDGQLLSDSQRKRIFAMIGDISDWACNDKEYARAVLTQEFCFYHEVMPFSLSDVDKSTASRFIRYLVEFCLHHGVPCGSELSGNCEDMTHYLYQCLYYKRCVVCGRDSEFHHCTGSRAGMGRKSVELPLVGLFGMALCRVHHNEIHSGAEQVFYALYHVEPCRVDAKIAAQYPHYRTIPQAD